MKTTVIKIYPGPISHLRRLLFGSLLLTAFLWSACEKLIEVPKAGNLILSKDVFSGNETATSAVMGLYSKMVTLNLSMSNGGLSVYSGLSADELLNPAPSSSYDPFSGNMLLSSNGIISNNIWSTAYRNIYHANAILEGLTASNSLSTATKKQLTGETLTIRAFYLFYLVNLFGDIPLTLTSEFEQNAVMPRTSSAIVYAQIIKDLEEAKNLLTANYPSSAKARPNLFVARALLARVYLYGQRWADAEAEASAVISSGLYNMEPDLNKTFLNTSNETIWQLVRETANTAEAAVFLPSSGTIVPPLVIRDNLLNEFEAGDLRKSRWLSSNIVNGVSYSYPYKYKIRANSTVSESLIVLRLAEQYLIRAEARLAQNNLGGAVSDLNVVRTRARAAATPAITNPLPNLSTILTEAELTEAIYHERQSELFCEWGHRWLDLKRSGRVDQKLTGLKPTWKPFMALYPIPFSETQTNIFLTQNPGYAN